MPNEMDWFGLMRGITELHVKSLGSPSGDGVGSVDGHAWNGAHRTTAESPAGVNGLGHGSEAAQLVEGGEYRLNISAKGASGNQAPSDSKDIAGPALASEDALAGTESGGEHPINSPPLHKFDAPSSQERSGSDQPAAVYGTAGEEPRIEHLALLSGRESAGQPRGASIHSGDTIDRLMDAVAVCEERSRR